MQKTTYIHADSNQQWDWSLPRVIRIGGMAIMGVTEENMAAYGITKTVTDLPDPEPVDVPVADMEALHAKERAFVAALLQYAARFDIDLLALPDINISVMFQAAHDSGASETSITAASAILLALTRDIEAEANQTWGECWAGLKTRIPAYIAELINQ